MYDKLVQTVIDLPAEGLARVTTPPLSTKTMGRGLLENAALCQWSRSRSDRVSV